MIKSTLLLYWSVCIVYTGEMYCILWESVVIDLLIVSVFVIRNGKLFSLLKYLYSERSGFLHLLDF